MRLDKEIEEIKKAIAQFRTETKQRLELIENEVRKQLSSNYNRTIFDYLNKSTLDFIKCLNCQKTEIKLACKEKMISIQQNYIDLLKNGNLSESMKALEEAVFFFSRRLEDMKGKENVGCAECFRKEIEILQINRSFLAQLQELQSPWASKGDNHHIAKEMNPAKIVEDILNPVSQEARLKILLSIFNGKNRFADFIETTGLKGGHLLYHLNRLLEHGFIQRYASKDYILTRKGLKTVSLLMQTYEEYDERHNRDFC